MKIKSCIFESFLIHSPTKRKGILLQLKNEEGFTAISEISPLCGYSQETFEKALLQLHVLKPVLLNTDWKSTEPLCTFCLYPSVYFGVESGLLDLLNPIEKMDVCKKYALLCGTFQEILFREEQVYREGYKEAKIKLGSFSLESAHRLIERIGNRLHLRIDLNRQWDVEKSLAFFSCYPKEYFEYVEEPVQDLKDLSFFSYPFALDETLREDRNLTLFLNHAELKALILKPTLIYPLTPFLKFPTQIVLSSSFESPIGIRQIEKLSHRLQLNQTFHGIDTLRYFESNEQPMPHSLLEKTKP